MTMPASGALNMGGTTTPQSVANELGLGLTTTISMNQAAVRTLAAVGGTGTTWSMSSLYNKSARTFSLASLLELFGEANTGDTAFAEYAFGSDGSIVGATSQSGSFAVGNWTTPTTVGIGSSYWIRVTETASSGTSTVYGATRGVWLQLSSLRTYGLSRTANGLGYRIYTVEISSDSGGVTIVASITGVQINVEIIF
jgi:hypothetical protein